ncbi:MAG: hypothetical protein EOP84_27450 [Verrucomicrobiaceae bacterium]|nr:MAG: hypothetical protein EOP84_27450 [Verrucomicrobiaceae bacterium]
MELTWDDLIIQDIPPAEAQSWIAPWSHMISGQFAPIFMSKFGDWFLRRPDDSTDELSIIEGTLVRIAATAEEFASLVNNAQWQEQHLLSSHVAQLHQRGLIPGRGQCYGFAPHPILTGRINIDSAQVMSISVWQFIAAQSFFRSIA